MGATPIHVVAGILWDAAGRVLVARRPEGKAEAGLWEFPGGKVEPGETAPEALAREWAEELGVRIDATCARPLIRVPVAGPDGALRLRLDAWEVAGCSASPRAIEHSALDWLPPSALPGLPMPVADRPIAAALTGLDRVLVLPDPGLDSADELDWLGRVDRALAAGLRRLHLRLPPGNLERLARLVRALAPRCGSAGASLRLHGLENAGLARGQELGLHLRAWELANAGCEGIVQRWAAEGLPLSAATHDATELRRAVELGVDDVFLGPVNPTPTHPEASGLGWEGFETLRATAPGLPVYALGGVGPTHLRTARQHGAQGIAAIRGLWPA